MIDEVRLLGVEVKIILNLGGAAVKVMPILVKDYTWRETESHVIINVPLKGVKPNKTDVFSTDLYIKVNFPPYLFEIHLAHPVSEDQCTVNIGNGLIVFNLVKKERGLWGNLCSEGNRVEFIEKKLEAVEYSHQRAKDEQEMKAKKKREEEQYAIRQQMRLEQEDKERTEKEKQEERNKATMEIDKWKDQGPKDIWTGKKEPLPAPLRQTGEISVHFTYREFSTAARESKYAEEQEWLAKMAAARKIKSSDTSDINEANPEFLKDKGINFFKAGNYEAAINVFTEAIKSNNLLPSLYANRAACFLSIGKYEDCIDDCGKALDLYYPVVPSNYLSRAKVFVRRGTAYASMEDYHLALQDYDSALKLSPNDEKLKEDYEKIKEFATKNPKH